MINGDSFQSSENSMAIFEKIKKTKEMYMDLVQKEDQIRKKNSNK